MISPNVSIPNPPPQSQQLREGERQEVWDNLGGCGTSGESWGHQAVAPEPGEVIWKREARICSQGWICILAGLNAHYPPPPPFPQGGGWNAVQQEWSKQNPVLCPAAIAAQEMLMRQCRWRFQHQKENFHKPRQALTKSVRGMSSNSLLATGLTSQEVMSIDDVECRLHISMIDISPTRQDISSWPN